MKDRKKAILQKLQKQLKEWEIEALYRDGKKENIPMDILTVLITEFGTGLTEVLGEFFFLPAPEGADEDVLEFCCVLTLTEELTEDMLPRLYEACSAVNFFVETGSFCVNKSGEILVYRNSLPLPAQTEDDDIVKLVLANVGVSLSAAEQYIDLLFNICNGEMSMDELYGLFPDA